MSELNQEEVFTYISERMAHAADAQQVWVNEIRDVIKETRVGMEKQFNTQVDRVVVANTKLDENAQARHAEWAGVVMKSTRMHVMAEVIPFCSDQYGNTNWTKVKEITSNIESIANGMTVEHV